MVWALPGSPPTPQQALELAPVLGDLKEGPLVEEAGICPEATTLMADERP